MCAIRTSIDWGIGTIHSSRCRINVSLWNLIYKYVSVMMRCALNDLTNDLLWHLIPFAKACGACSTTQDLATYLDHVDLTELGTKCVAEGLLSFERGVECFTSHGLTRVRTYEACSIRFVSISIFCSVVMHVEMPIASASSHLLYHTFFVSFDKQPCAMAWIYDGYKTRDACLRLCVRSRLLKEPNNGPPPLCELNDCLQCDEDEAGPIFKKFAARTRRRSGLLSKIARPCEQIVYGIDHNLYC